MADLFKRPRESTNYLSPEIQNERINLIAHEINVQIKNEVDEATVVTIKTDATQDLSKINQLSTVFSYVLIKEDENEKLIELQTNEMFCGFMQIMDQISQGLETILKATEYFKGLSKLHGQGNDSAANISGVYSNLQTRIRQCNPAARFVHDCTHNLNLVISGSILPLFRQLDEQLERIYVF